ncbi:MAG: mandelate racemase/muconate lactonizing enzyme family protein [Armatimonadetes bacterium]|nr:mandelate racemase/muconate lactonizing enzyme family protein [Armatimonadota bacterium]
MRITALRTTDVRVPLNTPAKWSGGTRLTAPAILVEIDTDEGITGLGECVGPTIPTLHAILEREFAPFLIGADPLRHELLLHRLDEFAVNWAGIARYAIAGIDIALWDLKAKALGTSVCNLLGGVYRDTVEFMGYLFIDRPETNAAQARRYVDEGYHTLKVKVGRDIEEDARRLQTIRDAVGWDVALRIDANMAWSRSTALRAIQRLSEFKLQYVEQPIPDTDIDGLAWLSRTVNVPIAADEACTSLQSALELISRRACEVLILMVSEAGGLTRARDIVHLADAAGIHVVLGTWAELGVGTIAGAHLIAASRNFTLASDTHYSMQDDDVLTEMLPLKGGRLPLPLDRPGLGVELDPARVEHYHRLEARDSVFYDPDNPAFIPRTGVILP